MYRTPSGEQSVRSIPTYKRSVFSMKQTARLSRCAFLLLQCEPLASWDWEQPLLSPRKRDCSANKLIGTSFNRFIATKKTRYQAGFFMFICLVIQRLRHQLFPRISGRPSFAEPITTTLVFGLLAKADVASIPFHFNSSWLMPLETMA